MNEPRSDVPRSDVLRTDVLVVGGGLGGVAAALGALRGGSRVILTEEYAWLGGQLTSQAVPPDEHTWVEEFGTTASYRALRNGIRDYYRSWFPLTEQARSQRFLNPGAGLVSRLCAEPRVAVAVIQAMLQPHLSSGRLRIIQPAVPVSATTEDDRVLTVTVRSLESGAETTIGADYVIDATELGDLLPLTGTEYVTGFESRADTGEPSAPPWRSPATSRPSAGASWSITSPARTTRSTGRRSTTGGVPCSRRSGERR
jgi:hypothetical protein